MVPSSDRAFFVALVSFDFFRFFGPSKTGGGTTGSTASFRSIFFRFFGGSKTGGGYNGSTASFRLIFPEKCVLDY